MPAPPRRYYGEDCSACLAGFWPLQGRCMPQFILGSTVLQLASHLPTGGAGDVQGALVRLGAQGRVGAGSMLV